MSTLAQRFAAVEQRVREACIACGRDPQDVLLIAVSKTVGPEVVGEGIETAGMAHFAENRTEVMLPKVELYPDADWHFIGNIQARQIKNIVGKVNLIHSVDRESIIPRLNKCAEELGIVQNLLLEVNVSGEESKSGFEPSEVAEVLAGFAQYANLRCVGFMTMAPIACDEEVRATFRGLRELRDELRAGSLPENVELRELSMGMSGDFEIAIEEGATMVRVGRSIFMG